MTTTYDILATVSLMHDYYADGRCPDFDIVPSSETAKALKGAGMLTKTIGNALILLVKMDGTKTYLPLPDDLKLTFYVQLNNTSFLNFSNVPYAPGSAFYFSNVGGMTLGANKYLNTSVPAFSNAVAYAIGDMVKDGANVFEAVKPVSAGAHATSDAAFWQQRASEQYAHRGDLILLTDGVLRLQVPSATEFDIQLFRFNPASGSWDTPMEVPLAQKSSQAVSAIVVNLQGISEGRYRLRVNGADHNIYIDAAASYGRVFGVLELYNNLPPGTAFDLTTAADEPTGSEFLIRFPNRLAIWKYIARTTLVTGVEMTSFPAAFVAGPLPKQFVSAAPIPLRQTPVKTLQLMNGATVLASRLANPPPDRIAIHTDGGGNKYFCAEMYLNY